MSYVTPGASRKKIMISKDENKEIEQQCNKCRELILHWGMQCKACRMFFHLETCCNIPHKMFDNYQEIKNAEGLWWFCQKCDMKIVDFVKNDVDNQNSTNDNTQKNSIGCINLDEEEINENNLDFSDTKVKYEVLRALSVVNSPSNSEDRTSETDHNELNVQHSDKAQNAESINNKEILQDEGSQSQAANTNKNLKRKLEIRKQDDPISDQSQADSLNENIDKVLCKSKNKVQIDDDSESEEELNTSKKRDINVIKESSSEDNSSLPDVSLPKKRNHNQITNSEDDFSDNGNKKRKRMLRRKKKSSEIIVTDSHTRKCDNNEISDSEEENNHKTPKRYRTPTNIRPVKHLGRRKRRRIVSETSESDGSDNTQESSSDNAQESNNEDNFSKDEAFSSHDEDYCSENTTEVENETDESYESYDDFVQAEMDEVLAGVGRSGYDVPTISYQGQGYKHTPKKKKRKTLTLEQRIKKRLYPTDLLNKLRKNSVEQKSVKKILGEWKFHAYQYVKDDTDDINDSINGETYVHEEDTNQCSCKKKDLRHLFFMKNIRHKDHAVLIVGSECFSWFYDTNSSNLYKIFVDVFTKKRQYTFTDIVEDSDNDDEDESKIQYEFKSSDLSTSALKSHQKAMLKTFSSIPFNIGRKHTYVYASPWKNENLQLKKKFKKNQDYYLRFFSKVQNEKLVIYVKSSNVQKCNENHKNNSAIVKQLMFK